MARSKAPRPGRRAGPPREKQLLIKPVSGRCNLACGYCFYTPVQAELYPSATCMSGEVLSEMIRQHLERAREAGAPGASFSWQGGEPMLAGLDFFREAVSLMMRHGRGGQAVGNALQTNAVLADERWADFLAEYRFLVGASVDGPEDLHSRWRGGTFARALGGAKLMASRGVEVNVLSVVSRASEGRAEEIYGFLRGEGFQHMQFIPCVEPIRPDWSVSLSSGRAGAAERPPVADFSVRPEAYADFLIELFEAWRADGEAACVRLFDAVTEVAATGRSPYCVLSERCGQYLVVEATGDLYPCDFFVRSAMRLGNLIETPLGEAFESRALREFASLKELRPDKCRSCRWWRVCHGGCLKDRLAAGGFERPTYFCEAYRRFLDHAWKHLEERARRLCGVGPQP